jgi:hypothetical protein
LSNLDRANKNKLINAVAIIVWNKKTGQVLGSSRDGA